MFRYDNLYLSNQPFFTEKFNGSRRQFEKKLYKYISKNLNLKKPKSQFNLKESNLFSINQMASTPLALNFFSFLCKIIKPKKILEIGSFIGYSTLSLAKASGKNCKIYSIEKFKEFFDIANYNFKKNKLDKKIKLLHGDANIILNKIKNLKFDLVFIDGDKENYLNLFKIIEKKYLTKNALVIVDNFFFHGDILNKKKTKKGNGVFKLGKYLEKTKKFHKAIIPLYDGIVLLSKK